MKPHDRGQVNYKYRFDSFELDPQDTSEMRLFKDGQPWKIQDKQFQLLTRFVEKPRQLIGHEELIKAGWDYDPCPDDPKRTESRRNNLHKQVSLLGKIIGEDAVESHRGHYLFKPEVTRETVGNEPDGAYEDLTFQWILNAPETRRIELFFFALIALSMAYLLVYGVRREALPASFETLNPGLIVSVIQFIVIAVAFIVSRSVFKRDGRVFPESAKKDRALMEVSGYTDPNEWQQAKESASELLASYLRYWRIFLVTWTVLYLVMIGSFLEPPEVARDIMRIAMSLTSNINTLAIALCFVVLNQPIAFEQDGAATDLTRACRGLERYGKLCIVLAVLVHSVLVWLGNTGKLAPAVVANSIWALDFVSSFVGGVALALFVGRVQSKFLGPSTWLPMALYLYVGLQTLYVAVSDRNDAFGAAVIIEVALVLKCLLFLFVIWLFKSGRFLFYFIKVKRIYEQVNPHWKTFFLNLEKR